MEKLNRPLAMVALCWALAAISAACGGGGGGDDQDSDAAGDTAADDGSDGDAAADPDAADAPDEVEAEDTATDDAGAEDTASDDVAEEEVEPGCGDSETTVGERCDDGNTETEDCMSIAAGACLADCSLDMSECGDGSPDLGEQCDDGDDDSMDLCTTSCLVHTNTIGAPCTCTGSACSSIDPTAGTIAGCDDAALLADSTRELACLRSAEPFAGMAVYFPEGYCTLMAFSCENNDLICGSFRVVGDPATITCPTGYAMVSRVVNLFGAIITTKTCHNICTADADCRWAAVEAPDSPWPGVCGQYACMAGGDSGELICMDARTAI